MAISSKRSSSTLHPRPADLLILFSAICSVDTAPVTSTLCPQESIPSTEAQSWPNSIIPYELSSNLTNDVRREILTTIALWERRLCYSLAFIPRHPQYQETDHFVHFVPGERCCLDRGRTHGRRQNVYVNSTCISDGTLEDVMGALIGNTRNTPSNEGADIEPSNPGGHPNTSSSEDGPTLIPAECQGTCIKHIIGAVNRRSSHGNIYSPDYPLDYPNNAECVWKITVPGNAVLQLTLKDFDTECTHDYLEIHHLKAAEGSIESLDRLCGDISDHDVITSHLSIDTVIIRFHSDATYSRQGFNISYEIIENEHQCDVNMGGCNYNCETDVSTGIGKCVCQEGYKISKNEENCRDINECKTASHGCEQKCRNSRGSYQCSCNEGYALSPGGKRCTSCEEEFNTTEGIIHSQGYPGPYQHYQNCNYTIHILPDHVLRMTLFVDINRSGNCTTEFLKLEHGYFMYNRRLCGYVNNVSYYIRDGNVTSTSLRFRTKDLNSVNQYPSSGFQVQFRQVLRSSVTEEELNKVHNGTHIIQYPDRPWLKFK